MKLLKKYKGLFADLSLIYVAAIWGSTFVMVKESLDDVNPVVLVGYRFMAAAFLMAAGLILFKKNIFKDIKKGIILGTILWLMYVPQTVGLQYTKASNSAFITGLFIIFVPLFAFILFKDKPSKMKMVSVVMAISGLWVLTGGLKEINLGDLLTLITAVTSALHILVAGKYVKRNINPYILNFQQFLMVAVLSFVYSALFGLPLHFNNNSVIYPILFLALFPTLSAFLIQLVAQRFTSSVKVAIIFCLEPVFAALFAWTVGGEKATIAGIAGGVLIVGAMILSEMKFDKEE